MAAISLKSYINQIDVLKKRMNENKNGKNFA